jgi:amidase
VVADAVRAFEQAGAHVEQVKLGIEHDQRELSDLWCRLIIPINVGTFEAFKREGTDLLADHREDFPQEYLRWIDHGYELRAPQLMRDEELRSEIYDAIQGVLDGHELIVTPTLACLPVNTPATATPRARRRSTGSRSTRLSAGASPTP